MAKAERLVYERVASWGIMSALAGASSSPSTSSRSCLSVSDGNLTARHARQASKRPDTLPVTKSFEDRRSQSVYRPRLLGRSALHRYLDHVEAVIKPPRRPLRFFGSLTLHDQSTSSCTSAVIMDGQRPLAAAASPDPAAPASARRPRAPVNAVVEAAVRHKVTTLTLYAFSLPLEPAGRRSHCPVRAAAAASAHHRHSAAAAVPCASMSSVGSIACLPAVPGDRAQRSRRARIAVACSAHRRGLLLAHSLLEACRRLHPSPVSTVRASPRGSRRRSSQWRQRPRWIFIRPAASGA